MGVAYYAVYDEAGEPIALFRKVQDDEARTLDLERLTGDGSWVNDPTLIDEIRDGDAAPIDASDAVVAKALIVGATSQPQPDPGGDAQLAQPPAGAQS